MFKLALASAIFAYALVSDLRAETSGPFEIKPIASTESRAQAAVWLNGNTFIFGRWDGSISIYRLQREGERGPVLLQSAASPGGRGVEMVEAVDDRSFLTSDGASQLALWQRKSTRDVFRITAILRYPEAVGTANSGQVVPWGNALYFVSGHKSGRLLVWRRTADARGFQLVKTIDVSSPSPPANPWNLRNVRSLAFWGQGRVISGSEDGDLVAVGIPDGNILFRYRYNALALRGINSVSVASNFLVVANCAVGKADRNLWVFDLSGGKPHLMQSKNLSLDPARQQSFDFDVKLVKSDGMGHGESGWNIFASTEEGFMWKVAIKSKRDVEVVGLARVSQEGAAALAVSPGGRLVVTAGSHIIRLFKGQ